VKHEPSSNKDLANKKLVKEILIEALTHNDMETFQDVLVGYIRTSSKLALSKKTKLGRTTLYDLINPEKPFNPTLDTIGKIFEELAA
jgi:DNA-binding phage protein